MSLEDDRRKWSRQRAILSAISCRKRGSENSGGNKAFPEELVSVKILQAVLVAEMGAEEKREFTVAVTATSSTWKILGNRAEGVYT